jgi:hypothetical protein
MGQLKPVMSLRYLTFDQLSYRMWPGQVFLCLVPIAGGAGGGVLPDGSFGWQINCALFTREGFFGPARQEAGTLDCLKWKQVCRQTSWGKAMYEESDGHRTKKPQAFARGSLSASLG